MLSTLEKVESRVAFSRSRVRPEGSPTEAVALPTCARIAERGQVGLKDWRLRRGREGGRAHESDGVVTVEVKMQQVHEWQEMSHVH